MKDKGTMRKIKLKEVPSNTNQRIEKDLKKKKKGWQCFKNASNNKEI